MFKKALLSSLVSAFLALSIFTVATAFGETTPSDTPPSGLASPTFGGLRVNGTSYLQTVQNGEAGLDPFPVNINDDLQVLKKIQEPTGNTKIEMDANGFKAFHKGDSFQFDLLNGLYAYKMKAGYLDVARGLNVKSSYENRDVITTDSIGNITLYRANIGVSLNLGSNDITYVNAIKGPGLAATSSTGLKFNGGNQWPYWIDAYSPIRGGWRTGLDLRSNNEASSIVLKDDTVTVTGKLKATSIGTWTLRSSNSDAVGTGATATAISDCSGAGANAIAASCEFGSTYTNARFTAVSHLSNTGCLISAVMPTGGYITSYVMCFNPSL